MRYFLFALTLIITQAQAQRYSKNEKLVADWFDAYNRNDSVAMYSIFADNFRSERNGKPEAMQGPALAIYRMKVSEKSSPGRIVEIVDMFSSGNKVVARISGKGYNINQQKKYVLTGINTFEIEDGKIIKEYQSMDDYGYLTQLGYSVNLKKDESNGWKMIYRHDSVGNVIEGSKEALLKHVRQGHPVRYGYRVGERMEIEHIFPANHITISKDHLYAQNPPMASQRWDSNDLQIWFGAKPFHYYALAGTDGNIDHMGVLIEDEKVIYHQHAKHEIAWYVQAP